VFSPPLARRAQYKDENDAGMERKMSPFSLGALSLSFHAASRFISPHLLVFKDF